MRKRNLVLASSFFFSLGTNILGFSLIFRLSDRFSFTTGKIGAFIALGQLFYIIGCNIFQFFGSVLDPFKCFSAATAVVFITSIPIGFSGSPSLLYVSYWIFSAATGLFWPPIMAWLTGGLNDTSLNREISFFNRSWSMGNILGPLIAGTLYNWNSKVNFLLLVISYFIVLIFLFLFWRDNRRHSWAEAEPPDTGKENLIHDERIFDERIPNATEYSGPVLSSAGEKIYPANEDRLKSPVLRNLDKKLDLYRYRAWIGAFLSAIFVGVFTNIIPLHIRNVLGRTERIAGMLLFFRCIIGFAGFSVLVKFTSWQFNRRWFLVLEGGLILCSFFFLFAGNSLFVFFFFMPVYGFINSACYNNSIFYSGATGREPHKNMALHEIFICAGSALGTAGGGLIYQHFGYTGTYLAMILVLGAGLGVLIRLGKKPGALKQANTKHPKKI